MTSKLTWLNVPALRLADAEHAATWDALNARRSNLPFLGADALLAALRVFGRGDERLLVGRDGGGVAAMLPASTLRHRPLADLPAVADPARRLGRGARRRADRAGALAAARAARRGAGAVHHADRPPARRAATATAPPARTPTTSRPGWIDVAGSFADYWATRGKNLRSNVRKQHNRLAASGISCEFVELRGADQMAPALARYGALESAGWKGREGTAIHPDNEQGRFYRTLLEGAADRGEAVVHEYRIDGRTVASNLCLERGSVFVILKTTYDETLDSSLSPAFLLHHAQLRAHFCF
ncbi:MAG: GNAT family N-acetyltransferase [Comamonadaceae bacterium]|nr:GNAT family N-acetyltransferase [Comamonadaceae bacterium]